MVFKIWVDGSEFKCKELTYNKHLDAFQCSGEELTFSIEQLEAIQGSVRIVTRNKSIVCHRVLFKNDTLCCRLNSGIEEITPNEVIKITQI